MNGFEFLETFRSLDSMFSQNIEIVVLTSSNNPVDIAKAKAFNVKAYINKPLTVESLELLFDL